MFPSACSFIVLVFTVSLHVSAYMAIFKCVGYFVFICLKDSASLRFFGLFYHVITLVKITKENRGKNTNGNMQSETT
jgi:hypothetical protein